MQYILRLPLPLILHGCKLVVWVLFLTLLYFFAFCFVTLPPTKAHTHVEVMCYHLQIPVYVWSSNMCRNSGGGRRGEDVKISSA